MKRIAAALALLPMLAGAVSAAEEPGRFQLEKTENGFVRMDTRTGQMSMCEERGGQLVCRLAADERSAFQDEIDRLHGRIGKLDDRIAKLENSLAARLESSLPTEQDFERSLGYMERFFRSFMGLVREFDRPSGPESPPVPQKTGL